MGQGVGNTTITFANDTQSAQTAAAQVVTDIDPNPNEWKVFKSPVSGYSSSNRDKAIAYGAGLFVMIEVNIASLYVYSSADGINWTARILPTTQFLASIAFGTGGFVIVCHNVANTYISSDGISWGNGELLIAQPTAGAMVAFSGGYFVAMPTNTTPANVNYSTNVANTWSAQSPAATQPWSITATNGYYYVTLNGTFNVIYRATSLPTVWNSITMPTTSSWTGVAYGNGIWLASASGGIVSTSTTGDSGTWTNSTSPTVANSAGVTFVDGYFYLLGNTSVGGVARSINGKDWEVVQLAGSALSASHVSSIVSNGVIKLAATNASNGNGYPAYAYSGNVRTLSTANTTLKVAAPAPGSNDTTKVITGLTSFTSTDTAQAWIMGSDSTLSHNSFEHAVAPIRLRITNPITGVGFTIQASSEFRLTGDFKVRYAYSS
jgi:hypothetical protein